MSETQNAKTTQKQSNQIDILSNSNDKEPECDSQGSEIHAMADM